MIIPGIIPRWGLVGAGIGSSQQLGAASRRAYVGGRDSKVSEVRVTRNSTQFAFSSRTNQSLVKGGFGLGGLIRRFG